MKKTIMIGIMFLFIINIASAEELYSKDSDVCKIIVQDYMQEYIDYECEVINLTSYTLKYKINNDFFFDVINNCTFDDDDCSDDFAKLKNETVKEFEKETKKVFGFGEMYNYDEYLDNYLTKKDKKEQEVDIKNLKKEKEFPIEYLTQNINHKGKINPFNKNGEIIIDTMKDSYNKIKIGYGSVIIEFNNSKESENMNMTFFEGYNYQQKIRYLEMYKFIVMNYSFITLKGIQGEYSPFNEFDYFLDSGVNSDIWSSFAGQDGTISLSGLGKDRYVQLYADPGCGTGTTETYIISDEYTTTPYVDVKKNVEMYIDYSFTSIDSGAGDEQGGYSIFIQDSSSNQATIKTESSYSVITASRKRIKVFINETEDVAYIYETSPYSTPTTNVSLSGLSGTRWYIKFRSFSINPTACGGYLSTLKVYNTGYYDTSSPAYTAGQINYPQNFSFYIGDDLVYENSNFNTETTINITGNISKYIDSCTCADCVNGFDTCIIPMYFNDNAGGVINYSNINITYEPAFINLTLNLYDSETLNKIDYANITVQIIGEQYQTETTTDDGNITTTFFFSEAESDKVEIRSFSSDIDDYSIITRVQTLTGEENVQLNLYLTNTTDTDKAIDVQFITLNTKGLDRLENALVKVYKQNPSTNEDILLTELYTHSDGQATTKLISDTVFYRFSVEYQNSIVYTSENAISLTVEDSPLKLYCILEAAYSQDFLSYAGLNLELDFNKIDNESGYYSMLYSGEGEYEICFNDYYIINTVRTDSTDYCVNGSSGSNSFSTISVNQFANVYGKVYVDFKNGNGKEYYTSKEVYLGLDDASRQAKSRLFVYFGLILICGIVFVYYPSVALILFILATSALSYTKFILLSPGASMLIISLTMFVLITYNRKK